MAIPAEAPPQSRVNRFHMMGENVQRDHTAEIPQRVHFVGVFA